MAWPRKRTALPGPDEGAKPAPGPGVDVLDVLGVVFAVAFVAGLFLWFGPGPALTVIGGFGGLGVLVFGWLTSRPPAPAEKKAGG
ncbi:hypothetical protein [Amycolatopsis tolypomycina]|uniref:hypothetical protein n=1 Tax=Amycolatopsis tolypomycina TaxID=208445 RepID=UPI0033B3FB2C